MENLLKKIEELRERLGRTWQLLDIDGQISESRDQKRLMSEPDFWNDQKRAIEIGRRVEELDEETKRWTALKKEITELEELTALAEKEGDEEMHDEARKKYDELLKKYNDLEFLVLFSGKYDASNAIVSVHAGVGGVDAQDFAQMLERMLLRFAEKHKFKAEILDRSVANEAGIKSVTFRVAGHWAYGYFKGENGVHRLVRISPFDAESMRHTSFALVEVVPELPADEDIEIREEDIKWEFYHSSGPGGQNVNKTSTAVRLTHVPSKIVVACQTERSQYQNREIALKILKAKLHHLAEQKREAESGKLRGDMKLAEWGRQIRSYVLQPYQMVKDHRTEYETTEINKVLDGDLDNFAEAYLRWLK